MREEYGDQGEYYGGGGSEEDVDAYDNEFRFNGGGGGGGKKSDFSYYAYDSEEAMSD